MNIVFDAGGVLLDWNPQEIVKGIFPSQDQQNSFLDMVLDSDLWRQFDAGCLHLDELVLQAHAKTGLDKQQLLDFVSAGKKSLTAKHETVDLVKDLHTAGYRLYLLSNMPPQVADYVQNRYEFWNYFEDRVFSGYVGMSKPDSRIFTYSMDRWSVKPEEAIFIDDMANNIEAAEVLGMKTVLFQTVPACREQLQEHGIIFKKECTS